LIQEVIDTLLETKCFIDKLDDEHHRIKGIKQTFDKNLVALQHKLCTTYNALYKHTIKFPLVKHSISSFQNPDFVRYWEERKTKVAKRPITIIEPFAPLKPVKRQTTVITFLPVTHLAKIPKLSHPPDETPLTRISILGKLDDKLKIALTSKSDSDSATQSATDDTPIITDISDIQPPDRKVDFPFFNYITQDTVLDIDYIVPDIPLVWNSALRKVLRKKLKKKLRRKLKRQAKKIAHSMI
jgi:hypothetical protein